MKSPSLCSCWYQPPNPIRNSLLIWQAPRQPKEPPRCLHNIDLAIELQPGKEPPYGPIYPLSPQELVTLKEWLEENLKKGFIWESKSPAGAPILFAPKKDGGLWMCIDYRGLNAITIKNCYPLPLITKIMDQVAGAQYFSKVDLKDAYHWILLKLEMNGKQHSRPVMDTMSS